MAAERVLLPPYAEPTHYDLDIVPDMDRFTFSATAKVTVTIVATCCTRPVVRVPAASAQL